MKVRAVRKDDDFEAIGEIYAQSWKTAYKGIVPKKILVDLDGSRWSDAIKKNYQNVFCCYGWGKVCRQFLNNCCAR